MEHIQIIGNKIYYRGVLVAELVDNAPQTWQGDFVDMLNRW